ncbi:MAG: acyl-CoA dehydrogenase family protein [Cyanobacteria bacterium HKST-UBA06]|nr:acyl-CoA dehydrogenase family protein [Cyanobacteria bacterium HKST-UBA04]MCA9806432.1 acyl-CoA dehydrogenase family protein [Cyanobacteria bacterium HKST-UBA06]MCA9840564.1 acyl-CoA dehydrogenase family protein [Cyanobacteria bacterium HKST-UBA03]
MFLELNEEQREIWRWAKEFADREIAPQVEEFDRKATFNHDLCKKIGQQGFFGAILPEKYGGQAIDYVAYALMTEEIARVCSSTRTLFSVQISLVEMPILKYGTEAQKEQYLPKLATGELIGCFGLTEPNAGSDAGNQQTTAVADGDHYILNGQKTWISNGSIADVAIIIAQTDKSKGHKGMVAFLVDTNTDGFSARPIAPKLGLWSSDTSELFLENVKVHKDQMLGEMGDGFKVAMYCLDQGRFSVACGGVGVMQGCLDIATNYAMERQAFDQKIGEFQQIQHMVADISCDTEAGRFLTFRAAHLKNKGVRNTRETCMAKLFCTEAAQKAAYNALQIFGGYGFSEEYPAARYYRDARVLTLYEGTSQIQRLILGQDALGIRPANGKVSPTTTFDRLCGNYPELAGVS